MWYAVVISTENGTSKNEATDEHHALLFVENALKEPNAKRVVAIIEERKGV